MKQKTIRSFVSILVLLVLLILPSLLQAQDDIIARRKINPDKELNPNTKWMRQAKWGLFTHYLDGGNMTGQQWNARVDAFKVKEFADQLSELKVPYFFITIGQSGDYYCSPNSAYERHFGPSNGRLSTRDLVAELAQELSKRNIRLCVYWASRARTGPVELQRKWQEVVAEWSTRWGKNVHAWWIDGGTYNDPKVYKAYTDAFKAGNPKALVAYNCGPVGMNRDQLMPATEYEDYLAGECDFILPTCGIRVFDGKEYYLGPNISGDQLHFLNFLGAWWGGGQPRFSDELVISWTRHINDHAGAVTWDLPLTYDGIISESYFKQVKAFSKAINK